MEVKIGIQNVNREISLESSQSPDEVLDLVREALSASTLELKDEKGRLVVIPSSAVAYVEVGPEESRRVGFGGS